MCSMREVLFHIDDPGFCNGCKGITAIVGLTDCGFFIFHVTVPSRSDGILIREMQIRKNDDKGLTSIFDDGIFSLDAGKHVALIRAHDVGSVCFYDNLLAVNSGGIVPIAQRFDYAIPPPTGSDGRNAGIGPESNGPREGVKQNDVTVRTKCGQKF